ncbi:MAG: hypothetical protein PHN56_01095 [Candidatus Nanoarchaeia archaeon]|nr:hypothetical protein [Candidatus Nanoarchaeia archaeon]
MNEIYNYLHREIIKNLKNENVKKILKDTLAYNLVINKYKAKRGESVNLVYTYFYLNKKINEYDLNKNTTIEIRDNEKFQKGPEFLAWKKVRFDDSDLEGHILDRIADDFLKLRGEYLNNP